MMYFDRKLTHWQFPVLFLDTRRKSLDGASYIALLREVNRLRFKCSQRGALSRSKKMACKDNSDDPEAVMV